MPENDKHDPTATSAQEDANFLPAASDAEQAEAAAENPAPPPAKAAKRGVVASVAWLALLLSLLSVAALGYLLFEKFRASPVDEQYSSAISEVTRQSEQQAAAMRSALAALEEDVAGLDAKLGDKDAELRNLQNDVTRFDSSVDLFDSVAPRLGNLERSLAALQGVSVDARNTYLLAEAEYYMQIANAQLQLAGNPYLAKLALEQADDRLLQLADPALTQTRRELANEIAALEVMEQPDVAGVTLTLASLAHVVESLPMKQTSAEAAEQAAAAETGGVKRAWNAVKGAVSGLVTYTKPTDEDAPLLTPEAEPMIRSNLALQLQAARLALLRGEQVIFEQSLDDADGWIARYFDTTAEPVQSARQTISEIRSDYRKAAPPDISQSLRLLRQYRTLAEVAE
tara:strand:- start:8615 stop:9811 length:1197 start_codon:yes stop_codon:yes gene_type:complete